jgi:ATP citrate (pro-S)-lyase
MARVKLTEYRSKTLLDGSYKGCRLRLESLQADCAQLDDTLQYAVKVDQGVKHRAKQGLVKLDVVKAKVAAAARELAGKGYSRFIAEPMLAHKKADERYLSIERTRDGMRILYSAHGGIDVEQHADKIRLYTSTRTVPLPPGFIEHLISVMNQEHLSFVEINPLVVMDGRCFMLDAAVLADSAGQYQASWQYSDMPQTTAGYKAEAMIAELNANSPASFSLRILNPNGAVWLLLSGGGASITIADAAYAAGTISSLGNYGEYSGGPTTEETYLYTKEVLRQMEQSKAPRKALVIAGGVANFTDVAQTFRGIVQALAEVGSSQGRITVFVRRGGPNEAAALKSMETFLKDHHMYGSVHGSDSVLTLAITEALEYVHA